MWIIAIIAVILLVVLFYVLKKKQTEKRLEEERLRRIAEEEERQRQIKLEEEARRAARKAEIEAGKEIYHYLNQSIKTMFYHYRTQKWSELTSLGAMELKDHEAARRCVDKLSQNSRSLVEEFFACLDMDQTYHGEGQIKDSQALKAVFEEMMLPFFPVYSQEFTSGPRYISFLNQRILKVFTQLSGKKFRLGYKNRYQNGQIAFEWTEDVYRVYRADGTRLCEASFADGRVKDGYAILRDQAASSQDWEVSSRGQWSDGLLQKEDQTYLYKKPVR